HSSHPVATGVPGHGYPYHWVIVEWITASTAGFVPLRRESARPFGDAIRQIHTPSPADAPLNPLTGPGLEAKRAEFESALNTVIATGGPESLIINPQATRDVYEAGVEVDFQVPHTWTHGRFEPRAVLSDQGAFRGVLLWHNFGAGDPA